MTTLVSALSCRETAASIVQRNSSLPPRPYARGYRNESVSVHSLTSPAGWDSYGGELAITRGG